jgi:hypothetical protein
VPDDPNLFELPPEPWTLRPVRARRRAADWRANLKRMFDYLSRRATPEQRETIRQAYEAELKLGPDFLRIWSGSKRADPHEQPPPPPDPELSPTVWLATVAKFAHEALAAARAEGEKYIHPVTWAAERVARFLAGAADDHCRVGGRSYAAIASGGGVSEGSAKNGVNVLEAYGFLEHEPMTRTVEGPLLPRQVQAPNFYRLVLPAAFRLVKGVLNAGPVRKTLKFAGELLGGVSRHLEEAKVARALEEGKAPAEEPRAKGVLSLGELLRSFVPGSECKNFKARSLPTKETTERDNDSPRNRGLDASLARLEALVLARNRPG